MSDRCLWFTDEQRNELKIHLNEKQIAAAERTCDIGRSWVCSSYPTVKEQRDKISDLQKYLKKASNIFSRLNDGLRGRYGCTAQILQEANPNNPHLSEIERLGHYLARHQEICQQIIDDLPKQKRYRADPFPVSLIWQAVVEHAKGQNLIRLSSAENSAFRSIVRVCYQAMTGKRDIDPERAIKKFISATRSRDLEQRKSTTRKITTNKS